MTIKVAGVIIMRNRIGGALYGMALGDAMGMPAELWGRKRTQKFFGRPITDFMDGPAENDVACNYEKGQFTDDTGQALVIIDSLDATDFVPDTADIAGRMLEWADKENAFENNILGPTSKLALAGFRNGEDTSAITDKALSNGSAMRIPPVGCLFRPEQKNEIVEFVYQVSRATHSSDVTVAGAAMIAAGVASAIVNDDFDRVISDILGIEEAGYERGCETFSPRLKARCEIGLAIAEKFRGDDEGFLKELYDVVGSGVCIIESVPAAVAIASYARDPEKSCILSANLGGDTDTIGAMATAICGAFCGMEKIRKDHIDMINRQNDINLEEYIDILMKGREKLA